MTEYHPLQEEGVMGDHKTVRPGRVVRLPSPTGLVDRDILVSDLAHAEESPALTALIQEIRRCWPEDDTRCGTLHASNESDGNGLIAIHLRFPLDIANLKGI